MDTNKIETALNAATDHADVVWTVTETDDPTVVTVTWQIEASSTDAGNADVAEDMDGSGGGVADRVMEALGFTFTGYAGGESGYSDGGVTYAGGAWSQWSQG